MHWLSCRETITLCIVLRVLFALGLDFYLSPPTSYAYSVDNGDKVVEFINNGPGLLSASSPLTLYANLKESLWLYQRGIDPYGSGIGQVGVSPLYLAFSFFPTIAESGPLKTRLLSKLFGIFLWTAPDAFSAWFLVRIWKARASTSTKSSSSSITFVLPLIYLLSPYVILSSLARSTSVWENAILLGAIAWACESESEFKTKPKLNNSNSKSKSLLFLALRVHLSLDALILLPPLILLLLGSPESRLAEPGPFALYVAKHRSVKKQLEEKLPNEPAENQLRSTILRAALNVLFEFMVYWTALALISTLIVGHWRWMSTTWGTSLSLPSMTPNPGLWWYFFTEMFDHFRPFFLVVFNVHLLMYVAPICIKFQHDPLYALFILVGTLATFKSYPTLSDHGLFIAFWGIFPEVYPYLRHPFPTTLVLIHSALLQPLFAHLWLSHGTGNANFYYASTLVGACAGGMAIVDAVWAGLRIALEKHGKGELKLVEGEEREIVTQQ
ncbi:PIG-U-domain-containing protein [Lentinula aff. detonsa]|uniref:PIG-U-domain-containing protein n=1 Tax=Lentinula aff. detonsa TaxID=2804958 RepID=A0AA38U5L6_9AGAR|nr:PIG-U-domain-containing protein [Lentinula aff. detonsa]